MKYLRLAFCFFAAGFILSACGKSSGGGGGDATKTIRFYESDGVCYNANSNRETSDSNCRDLDFYIEDGECFRASDDKEVAIGNCTTNTYFFGNSACFNRSGKEVDDEKCDKDGDGGGSASFDRVRCQGEYLLVTSDDIQPVFCDSSNDYCVPLRLWDPNEQDYVQCER